jgi:hypothetical protein
MIGQNARYIVDEAAAGDVSEGLDAVSGLERGEDRLDVDAGRLEEGFCQRLAFGKWCRSIPGEAREFDDLADAMSLRGSNAPRSAAPTAKPARS